MREFVEYIAKELVDEPDTVQVTEEHKNDKVVVTLKVGKSEVGKIIGKKGRIASAFRIIFSAVAAKYGKRGILEITE